MMGSFRFDGLILPGAMRQTNYLGGNGNDVVAAV
jgi:hypothetical protein